MSLDINKRKMGFSCIIFRFGLYDNNLFLFSFYFFFTLFNFLQFFPFSIILLIYLLLLLYLDIFRRSFTLIFTCIFRFLLLIM